MLFPDLTHLLQNCLQSRTRRCVSFSEQVISFDDDELLSRLVKKNHLTITFDPAYGSTGEWMIRRVDYFTRSINNYFMSIGVALVILHGEDRLTFS